jgi:polysaccharide deacetylase family protein (PEP-CTERM system associated)
VTVINALSVDVEDYFQVSAFSDTIDPSTWDQYDCRVDRNTRLLLDVFDRHQNTATFFVLGWVAARFPGLVKEIHHRGHEVASHGRAHQTLDQLSPATFREEVRAQKALLEDLIQSPIWGYRAPSFSVSRETMWALQILAEEGYGYDSSVFPVYHDRYGIPDAPRFPYVHRLSGGLNLFEFPMATVRVLGKNVPVAGGGYLRLFPYRFIRWGIRSINDQEQAPAIVYLHPWEVDPDQPRIRGGWLSRFRHYVNLQKTESRLTSLLRDFRFGTLRSLMERMTEDQRETNRIDIVSVGRRLNGGDGDEERMPLPKVPSVGVG